MDQQIQSDDTQAEARDPARDSAILVFLTGHRRGVAHKLNCVMLELSISPTPEDAAAGKSQPIMIAIPADYAEKVISSIQHSLSRLRQSN